METGRCPCCVRFLIRTMDYEGEAASRRLGPCRKISHLKQLRQAFASSLVMASTRGL